MRYSYKSLAFVWLITLGLFAVTGSGVVPRQWLLVLIAVALAAPALVLRSHPGATVTSHDRPWVVADERDRSLSNLGGIEICEWENDGGAQSIPLSGGIREPAPAAL
jgi:hypothetical protein